MKFLIVFLLCLTFTECENKTQIYVNPYFVVKAISVYQKAYKCEGPLGSIIIYSNQKYSVGDTLILTQKFTKTKQ